VTVADTFTGTERTIPADALVTVTARMPDDQLVTDLRERRDEWAGAGLASVTAIGDCSAPGTIAAAVWDGHRFAADLNEEVDRDGPPFRREVTALSPGEATTGT
ncbi:MAG: NADH:flavin oxidoreductase, partial [Acidimicrobiia bacterium]|nr:NADH:flavin oxidoreductase [Acidimicrobiia bacterium]